MTANSSIALTEEQLGQLDEALMDFNEAMAIDECHGFITALLVTNNPLPTDDWLRGVLGAADASADKETLGLLELLYQEIEHGLASGTDFEPLYIELDDEELLIQDYSGWSQGFIYGLSLLEADWEEYSDNIRDLIAPLARLALLEEDEEPDLSESEYEELVEMIPGSVAALYQYWHSH